MKTYKVLTLGSSGAGKTVFLASLFKQLSTQGEYSFFLEVADEHKRRFLNNVYTQVAIGEDWPQGTKYSEVDEWTFTCCVKTPDLRKYPACQFTYLDYAGGRITELLDRTTERDVRLDLVVAAKEADALLGILDGQKLCALMSGNNEVTVNLFLKQDLPILLNLMQGCRAPIQFVISKWDLVGRQFSLVQVRDRLLEIPAFADLVRARNHAGSPVRLIPTSSVGSDFVRPQPDGAMQKIPGAIPRPFQVEAPLAYVLSDGLRSRLSELLHQQPEQNPPKNNSGQNDWFLKAIMPILPFALNLSLQEALQALPHVLPQDYQFCKPILQSLVSLATSSFKGRTITAQQTEQQRRERDSSLKLVKDEETALKHAIDNFVLIQNRLQQYFPESELVLT